MPEENLTQRQIIDLGRKIGSEVNNLKDSKIFEKDTQQSVLDMATLALHETIDSVIEPIPEEVDIMDQFDNDQL